MESTLRRRFSIFGLVFILLGISGINISGAATAKYTTPGQPTNLKAVGGLNSATLTWKAPASNGGKTITSYKVIFNPGNQVHVCKSSSTRCVVDIANPNKPSPKPVPISYSFNVAAINSMGTGPISARTPYVAVKFRATIYIAPKYGPATPTPTPILPTIPTTTPTPVPSVADRPIACGSSNIPLVTTYDGTYRGNAHVSVTQGTTTTSSATSSIATTFTILNGRGTGKADVWDVNGCVTDAAGGGTVVASNSLYGAITFALKLSLDSATNTMGGTGKGVETFSVPVFGSITVEFVLNVTRDSGQ